jgi:hypothetical protein
MDSLSAAKAMSALPLKADMCDARDDFRYGPKADIRIARDHVCFTHIKTGSIGLPNASIPVSLADRLGLVLSPGAVDRGAM